MRGRFLTLSLVLIAAGLVVAICWRRFTPASFDGQVLRWGGDASGGAPYLIDRGPSRPIAGFEAELAGHLAQKLGVSSRFVQKYWDMLPQDLERGDIDIILNGYEWTPQRERAMASTVPYYVYRLQLLVAPTSPIHDWADLRRARTGKRLKIGVLSDSAAHRYVEKTYRKDVEIVALSEEGSTGVMRMVREGKLDATVQDLPAALYYVGQKHGYEDLRLAGEPIEAGSYVIFVRPNDTELRERLNEALRTVLRDGSLRRIYNKYGLWNKDQEELAALAENWSPEPGSGQGLPEYAWLLAQAAGVTVLLACLAMPLAMLIGLFVAVGRLYGPRWLDWILTAYVELLRGTPVLMQLFVIYYLLAGYVDINAFWAGVLGLAINYSAYEAENYRAGLLAIPRGQMEAALSLGMSKAMALRRIIVPQAVRLVIPPVTNDFIALFKDTSVCSVIAVVELTSRYRTLMVNDPHYRLQLGPLSCRLNMASSSGVSSPLECNRWRRLTQEEITWSFPWQQSHRPISNAAKMFGTAGESGYNGRYPITQGAQTMTPSFVDLLQRLECGDAEAAALLFDRYARRLIGLARRRLHERVRPKADADDVVNSVIRTFCRRAAERPFNLDGPDALWALLVEITLRKCGRWNRHFRTRKRDVRREQTPPPLSDSDCAIEPLDPAGPRPEDEAVLREMVERLLAGLDERTRAVCEMRLQGYEIKEIVLALKCSEVTVNRKIRLIKDRMKEL